MTEVTNSLGILPTIKPATTSVGSNQSPIVAIVLASCITFILIVILVIVALSLVARYLKRKETTGKEVY